MEDLNYYWNRKSTFGRCSLLRFQNNSRVEDQQKKKILTWYIARFTNCIVRSMAPERLYNVNLGVMGHVDSGKTSLGKLIIQP